MPTHHFGTIIYNQNRPGLTVKNYVQHFMRSQVNINKYYRVIKYVITHPWYSGIASHSDTA